MLTPSTFLVGTGHDKKTTESRVTALMFFTCSGLGLAGMSGSVFKAHAVVIVSINARKAAKRHEVAVFI